MAVALAQRGPALALEVAERAAEPETAPHTSLDDRIVAALAEAGSPIQFADLRQCCRIRAATLYERLAALSAAGRIAKAGGGYRLVGG
jgi:hypothetical protein